MASRYLHLIRHGHYVHDGADRDFGSLSKLGKFQASCTGKMLKDELKINRMYSSSLRRAKETAEIIAIRYGIQNILLSKLLHEGVPYFSTKLKTEKGVTNQQIEIERNRMESAFVQLFQRHDGAEDIHDVVVCHGNIIRYFIIRCLGVHVSKWLRFDLYQCSRTTIKITDRGEFYILSFGEVGHIPPDKRTFT